MMAFQDYSTWPVHALYAAIHYFLQFDLWTDLQRKQFLDAIFRHCRRPQMYFTYKWIQDHGPMKHQDFTKVFYLRVVQLKCQTNHF